MPAWPDARAGSSTPRSSAPDPPAGSTRGSARSTRSHRRTGPAAASGSRTGRRRRCRAPRGCRRRPRGRRRAGEGAVRFGGEEDLAPVQPGAAYRLADACLFAVHLRGVDVPVADLEGGTDDVGGHLRIDFVDTEAALRDRVAVVEGECGNDRLGSHALYDIPSPPRIPGGQAEGPWGFSQGPS